MKYSRRVRARSYDEEFPLFLKMCLNIILLKQAEEWGTPACHDLFMGRMKPVKYSWGVWESGWPVQ